MDQDRRPWGLGEERRRAPLARVYAPVTGLHQAIGGQLAHQAEGERVTSLSLRQVVVQAHQIAAKAALAARAWQEHHGNRQSRQAAHLRPEHPF